MNFPFVIFRSKPGQIGPNYCWVCFYGCYAHYSSTLLGLFWDIIRNYKKDNSLAM